MKKKILLCFLMGYFLVGYRSIPNGNQWQITSSDSKIYLKFCANLIPTENDIGDSTDTLYGQTLTHTNIVSSIVNDYVNVAGSYVQIADSSTDSSYNSTTHAERTIEICTGGVGSMAGYASSQVNSKGQIIGCTITMGTFTNTGKKLIRTLTHEIGHCLGLDHPQETQYAVMSYFSEVIRLQNDDKAGLTYLYPADSKYERTQNFGAACVPNN